MVGGAGAAPRSTPVEHPGDSAELPRRVRRRSACGAALPAQCPRYSPAIERIAILGNLCRDIVAGAPARPGGGAFYAARALARLGRTDVTVTVACAPADAALLVPPLAELGLPTTVLAATRSTTYSFHYEGERRVMSQDAVGDPWPPARAVEAAGDAEWVYVGALTQSDFSPETLAALATGGRRLLIDAHGVVRAPALGPLRTDDSRRDLLAAVTVLKLNEEEAETLAGGLEPRRLRALGPPEVLLTLGSQGSLIVTAEAAARIPATPVAVPVDPTGAGDTFSAAYLDARSRGADPAEAGRSASRFVAEVLGCR